MDGGLKELLERNQQIGPEGGLASLLSLAEHHEIKKGLSEERLLAQVPNLRNLISFFREYPDLFLDFIKEEGSIFHLYFYQRVFLRIAMRHRYVYATFPRG